MQTTTKPEFGELLTKHEVASLLRRSQRTVEIWMRRGILPYLKIGKTVLFDRDQVLNELRRRFGVGGSAGKQKGGKIDF